MESSFGLFRNKPPNQLSRGILPSSHDRLLVARRQPAMQRRQACEGIGLSPREASSTRAFSVRAHSSPPEGETYGRGWQSGNVLRSKYCRDDSALSVTSRQFSQVPIQGPPIANLQPASERYTCYACGYGPLHAPAMDIHARTTGHVTYRCKWRFCNMRFRSTVNKFKHEHVSHLERPGSCGKCNQGVGSGICVERLLQRFEDPEEEEEALPTTTWAPTSNLRPPPLRILKAKSSTRKGSPTPTTSQKRKGAGTYLRVWDCLCGAEVKPAEEEPSSASLGQNHIGDPCPYCTAHRDDESAFVGTQGLFEHIKEAHGAFWREVLEEVTLTSGATFLMLRGALEHDTMGEVGNVILRKHEPKGALGQEESDVAVGGESGTGCINGSVIIEIESNEGIGDQLIQEKNEDKKVASKKRSFHTISEDYTDRNEVVRKRLCALRPRTSKLWMKNI